MVDDGRPIDYFYHFKTGVAGVRVKANETFPVKMKLSRLVRFEVDPPFLVVEVQSTDGARHKYLCSSTDAELVAAAISKLVKDMAEAKKESPK